MTSDSNADSKIMNCHAQMSDLDVDANTTQNRN